MQQRPRFPWITDGAIPLVIAGCGVMGFHWPYAAGPILIVLGLLIFVIRLAWWVSHWPDPAKPSLGLMTPKEVIEYLGDETHWGKRTREYVRYSDEGGQKIEVRKNVRLEAFEEFQKAAMDPDTRIRAYGRLNGEGSSELIPHTFWLTNGLSLDVLRGADRTSPTAYSSRPNAYTDVAVERRGVIETWPRMGFLDRRADRKRQEREAAEERRFFESLPPAPDLVSLRDAGIWFYHHASARTREILRGGVPSPFESIEEHAEAFVKEAVSNGVGTLYGKWGPDLPYEVIGSSSAEHDPFESVLGSDRKLAAEVAVERSDLPAILAYYEEAPDAP